MKKIIISCNDSLMKEMLSLYFSKEKWEVITFDNCFQMFSKLEEVQPDIIIGDLNSSEISFEEFINKINIAYGSTYIFLPERNIVSSNTYKNVIFLKKPFLPEEILERFSMIKRI